LNKYRRLAIIQIQLQVQPTNIVIVMRTDIDRIVQNRPNRPIRPFKSIRSMDVPSPSPSPSPSPGPSPSLDEGDEWSDFVKDLESMPGTRMRPTKGRYIGWRAQRIEERLMRADAAELADAVAALCSMRVPRPPSLRTLPVARRTGPMRALGRRSLGVKSNNRSDSHNRRRSARIADQGGGNGVLADGPACPGCVPVFQPNQLGHMCPGGCMWTGDDDDDVDGAAFWN
jgi:hypothetical protein